MAHPVARYEGLFERANIGTFPSCMLHGVSVSHMSMSWKDTKRIERGLLSQRLLDEHKSEAKPWKRVKRKGQAQLFLGRAAYSLHSNF